MKSPGSANVLMRTTVLLVALCSCTAGDVTKELCEPGWVFNNGLCYFFSPPTDTMSPTGARDECYQRDAAFVRPNTKEELAFLQSQVTTRQSYGYWLNLRSSGQDYSTFDDVLHTATHITPPADTMPEFQPAMDKGAIKGDVCLAFHLPIKTWYSSGEPQVWFETVACSVLLKVACKGKKSSVPSENGWLTKGDDAFWVSSELTTFEKAESLCQEKDMVVVDDPSGLVSVLNTSLYDATPWWSAAKLGKAGPHWADGKAVDGNNFIWGNQAPRSPWVVLRHTGSAVLIQSSGTAGGGLPYVCKKKAISAGQYGCPQYWMRGGRSCYKVHHRQSLSWEKAKHSCERHDAHLLTIDSSQERLWLSTIDFGLQGSRFPRLWTSGNDRSKEGEYRWHDGSTIDSSIFPWRNGTSLTDNLTSRCTAVWISKYGTNDKYFRTTKCTLSKNALACQYTLRGDATSCVSGWKKHKDTCYFLDADHRVTYELNLPRCRSNYIGVEPLQVKTKDVYDFLASQFPARYYWLGLDSQAVPGVYTWPDGTVDDMSHLPFVQEPDNGGPGGKPQNCISTDVRGFAYDRNCQTRHIYICEKELPELSQQSGNNSGGADKPRGTIIGVHMLVVAMAFWAVCCM